MIGIDISDQSIKVIRLSNDDKRRLLSHCWKAVPTGLVERGVVVQHEATVKLLREALTECGIGTPTKDTVVASIPETESFLRVIEIPRMDESEVGEAVQWEVAQHIPFGVENVYVDWQWVANKRRKDRQEVLVGAAEKRVVDPLVKLLKDAKLDIGALELESQAIVRALMSHELRHKKGILIVDIGGEGTNVVIHDHGTIRFTASLHRGAESLLGVLTREEAKKLHGVPGQAELDNTTLIEKLRPGLDGLVIEIHGIVEFYTGLNSEHQVNEILLTGGGANLPGLDLAFPLHFEDVHVERGNPWVNIVSTQRNQTPPMDLLESVHYATAIGLAQRAVIR